MKLPGHPRMDLDPWPLPARLEETRPMADVSTWVQDKRPAPSASGSEKEAYQEALLKRIRGAAA